VRAGWLCKSQACACRMVVRDSGLCVRDGCVRIRLVRAGWLCESQACAYETVM